MNFRSLGALAVHSGLMAVTVEEATALGVGEAAKILLTKTRSMFGHYHRGAGPFQGWPQLEDATKEERVRQGYTENEPLLRSGDLMRSYEMEHEGLTAGVGSAEEKALGQEIGVPGHNVPARSTLGLAFVSSERKGFGALNDIIGATLMYGGKGMVFARGAESLVGEDEGAQDDAEQGALGSML